MRHALITSPCTLMLLALLAIATPDEVAAAQECTVRDRVHLAAAGYSSHEIERLCGTGQEAFDSSQPGGSSKVRTSRDGCNGAGRRTVSAP